MKKFGNYGLCYICKMQEFFIHIYLEDNNVEFCTQFYSSKILLPPLIFNGYVSLFLFSETRLMITGLTVEKLVIISLVSLNRNRET